jgi:hypothetical protein
MTVSLERLYRFGYSAALAEVVAAISRAPCMTALTMLW